MIDITPTMELGDQDLPVCKVNTTAGLITVYESLVEPGRLVIDIDHDGDPAPVVTLNDHYLYGEDTAAFTRLLAIRDLLTEGWKRQQSPAEMVYLIGGLLEFADLPGDWVMQ
jgi:hypothetical protein